MTLSFVSPARRLQASSKEPLELSRSRDSIPPLGHTADPSSAPTRRKVRGALQGAKGVGLSVLRSLSHRDSSRSTRRLGTEDHHVKKSTRETPHASSRSTLAWVPWSNGRKTPRSSPGSRPSRGGLPRLRGLRKESARAEREGLRPTGEHVARCSDVLRARGVTVRCAGRHRVGAHPAIHTFACANLQSSTRIAPEPLQRLRKMRVAVLAASSWPPTSKRCTSLRV